MRIAFLSPEYPTEREDAGGLATYVQRMSHALHACGHEAEVFVVSRRPPCAQIDDGGVIVHRVHAWARERLPIGGRLAAWLLQAQALASALERRHAAAPFDLVQSADFNASGLFVSRRPGRRHVVRCSSAADLYNRADRRRSLVEPIRERLERHAIRRADAAYAPSRYVAEHFASEHRLDVRVIRPPATMVAAPATSDGLGLPDRFLLHFGQLIPRKGTQWLSEALPLAWARAPDLTMVWAGAHARPSVRRRWRDLWGDRADQVLLVGSLPRPQLLGVLCKAEASVLPSLVDNLPNTVIESLMLGVPVVGSRGASIDELVEEDVTGHLVELGDARALADALVRVWRGETPVERGFAWRPPADMQPERAVQNVLSLAGSCAR